jgi:hypothetical protein
MNAAYEESGTEAFVSVNLIPSQFITSNFYQISLFPVTTTLIVSDAAGLKVRRIEAVVIRNSLALLLQEITSSRVKYLKPVEHFKIINLFGNNIVSSEGDEWKRFRKISAPAFSEVTKYL